MKHGNLLRKIGWGILLGIIFSGTSVSFIAPSAHAATELEYELLAPLPTNRGITSDITTDVRTVKNLSEYVIFMFQLLIGIAVGLAVIMIVFGGVEYMTSELPGGKSNGKERIQQALWGLALAIGAYLILYTIDPDILKSDLNIESATPTRPTTTHNVLPSLPAPSESQ